MDAAYAMPSSGSLSSNGAASRADTAKRLVDADLPKAIDLSHHLSRLAVHRQASSLKQLYQYMTVPGMITMAGGERGQLDIRIVPLTFRHPVARIFSVRDALRVDSAQRHHAA
jgi:hypothetical protein